MSNLGYVCIIISWVVIGSVVGLSIWITKDPNYLWAMFIPALAILSLLGQSRRFCKFEIRRKIAYENQ